MTTTSAGQTTPTTPTTPTGQTTPASPTTPTGQTGGTTSTGGPQTFPKGSTENVQLELLETSVGVCVGPGTTQSTTTLQRDQRRQQHQKKWKVRKNPDGTCPAGSHIVSVFPRTVYS